LASDPEIQIVGEAKDGVEAVLMTQQLRPHLVTMDIHMPNMDGYAATKEIMITAPTPIVVITGSTQTTEVERAMNALRAGAVAALSKLPGPQAPDFEETAQKLIDTLKAMAQVKVVRHWRPVSRAEGTPGRARKDQRAEVVAVATSTGGPAVLQRLLAALPGDFAAPILVVQHITPGFTPGLADWLNSTSDLQVKVARQGDLLTPHTVYLAPDKRHLGVADRNAIALSSAPPIRGFRPSGTFLFESVAQAFGAGMVALILTGMGEDGVEGLRAVRQAGGRRIAQDEKSCVVFGMPGAAISAGLVDEVLPVENIAARLLELV
jgi:two-component system chemotaxis response regulator CheB